MDLILISPEGEHPGEVETVRKLFERGLHHYHVRKPAWTANRVGHWLEGFDADERRRLVLHQHHEEAAAWGVGGLHWKDQGEPSPQLYPFIQYSSAACHAPEVASQRLGLTSALLLSPIFDSVSKPATHASSQDWSRLLHAPGPARRRTRCLALGGITSSRVGRCREQGFDGVAVLGAVWLAHDPLAAFHQLQLACLHG